MSNDYQLIDIEVLEAFNRTMQGLNVSLSRFGESWQGYLDAVHYDEAEPGADAMSPDTSKPYPF